MAGTNPASKAAKIAELRGLASKKHLDEVAIGVFKRVLQDERVKTFIREILRDAPTLLAGWAGEFIDWMKQRPAPDWSRVKQQFGHSKLERRVDVLRNGIAEFFPKGDEPGRADLMSAVESVATALSVTEQFPIVKRVQAHRRIDHALDQMERALLDAMLPG